MKFIENHVDEFFPVHINRYIAQAPVRSEGMKGLVLLQDYSLFGFNRTGFRDIIPHNPRVRFSDHLQHNKAINNPMLY